MLPLDPGLASEIGSYIEIVKAVGFPALIFLIWYIYHRSENRKWEENFAAQREMIQGMLKQSSEERRNQFELWREQSEILTLQTAQIARLETKISGNEFCPIVRRQKE